MLACMVLAGAGLHAQLPCGDVADFSVIGAGQCADLPVSFDVDLPNPDWSYSWDFGDGATSGEFQPEHAFVDAIGEGTLTFDVTLTCLLYTSDAADE